MASPLKVIMVSTSVVNPVPVIVTSLPTKTTEEIVVSDFYTWGCPVFILDAANQSGSIGTPK